MAYIDEHCKAAIEFAKDINPDIKIDNGINWIWATPFVTKEDAEKFDNFCVSNGCETRGVYSDRKENNLTYYSVRFR